MPELILELGKCEDLTGRTFANGQIEVLEFAGKMRPPKSNTKWKCRCKCGTVWTTWGGSLKNGAVVSCGCRKRAHLIAMRTTHGGCGTPEHEAWRNMHARCYYEKSTEYHNYGGRGIVVCERWHGAQGFTNFLADVGKRPSSKHSLDRFPNMNGNYEPGNVRWATWAQQARNKRSNHLLTHNGVTLTVTDWAIRLGLDPGCLRSRLKLGWDVERALTTPPGPPRRKKANHVRDARLTSARHTQTSGAK